MKDGKWIAIHKELKYFLPHGRQYTLLEAMFSYTLDIDNKREGTIAGYSKLWGWSRTKVRRFVTELKTGTKHFKDRDKTGKEHHILLKLNNLQERKNRKKTGKEQGEDTPLDTTINPNTKPDPKPKEKEKEYSLYGEFKNVRLSDKDIDKLKEKYNGNFEGIVETMSQHIASKKKDPYTGVTHYPAILKNDHWLIKEDKEPEDRFANIKKGRE